MSDIDTIRAQIWSPNMANPMADKDRDILLEQYKLYVASAEKISQNRLAANTFFLSFNTALIGALAGFFDKIQNAEMVDAFYVAALLLCLAWLLLLRSYRNLNSAKFKVIGMMEERLPASPYWRAEWHALGQGNDYRKYIPLSVVELAAPLAFAAIYLYVLIAL